MDLSKLHPLGFKRLCKLSNLPLSTKYCTVTATIHMTMQEYDCLETYVNKGRSSVIKPQICLKPQPDISLVALEGNFMVGRTESNVSKHCSLYTTAVRSWGTHELELQAPHFFHFHNLHDFHNLHVEVRDFTETSSMQQCLARYYASRHCRVMGQLYKWALTHSLKGNYLCLRQ